MREAFGHRVCEERVTMIKRKPKQLNKAPKIVNKYWDWIKTQKSVTKLQMTRRFMLNETTAGQILAVFVDQGKLKMLPRIGKEIGVWVKTNDN